MPLFNPHAALFSIMAAWLLCGPGSMGHVEGTGLNGGSGGVGHSLSGVSGPTSDSTRLATGSYPGNFESHPTLNSAQAESYQSTTLSKMSLLSLSEHLRFPADSKADTYALTQKQNAESDPLDPNSIKSQRVAGSIEQLISPVPVSMVAQSVPDIEPVVAPTKNKTGIREDNLLSGTRTLKNQARSHREAEFSGRDISGLRGLYRDSHIRGIATNERSMNLPLSDSANMKSELQKQEVANSAKSAGITVVSSPKEPGPDFDAAEKITTLVTKENDHLANRVNGAGLKSGGEPKDEYMKANLDVGAPQVGQDAGTDDLKAQLELVDFKPLNKNLGWLGIGHSIQARFMWRRTSMELINKTDASIGSDGSPLDSSEKMLPMVYLDELPCRKRKIVEPGYQCIIMRSCTIGEFDVRKSLSIDLNGIFSVSHKVAEGEKMNNDVLALTKIAKMGISTGPTTNNEDSLPGLDFTCNFWNPMTNESSIITATSTVKVLSKAPVASTAQVIKPTKLKTAIVGTVITVEAVLDQPGLRIVEGGCKINEEDTSVAFDLGRGLYTLEYVVREGDTDRPYGKLPFYCEFQDRAGNMAKLGPMDLQSWFSVNANPPKFSRIAIVLPGASKSSLGNDVASENSGQASSHAGQVLDTSGTGGHDLETSVTVKLPSAVSNTDSKISADGSHELPASGVTSDESPPQTGADSHSESDRISDALESHVAGWAPAASTMTSNLAHVGDTVVVELITERKGLQLSLEKCLLNGIDVGESMVRTIEGIRVALNVTTGQSDWFEGQLPIDCWIKDMDGNAKHITALTDNNKLAGDAHTPTLADYFPNLLLAVGFAVVSVASGQIAHGFPHVGLPLITGYLLTGILAGPEALGLIPEQSIRSLRFVDELSLAVIAITAGAKLYLPKMSGRWRSILWVMGGLIVFEYGIGAATIVALHPYIKFMNGMDENQILAVALMAGALVCARSPASAVAVVRELRAEGPFTDTVLGVTVLSDVSVIALFALTSLFSGSLLAYRQKSSSVVWVFLAQMILSSIIGWFFGILISFILSFREAISDASHQHSQDSGETKHLLNNDAYTKSILHRVRQQTEETSTLHQLLDVIECASVLSLGFAMFVLGHIMDPYVEPLIICMVGGFVVANYTSQRKELRRVMDLMTAGVMIAFFTLTGAALDLHSLSQTILISLMIFGGRIGGIVIGSSLGGWVAGDPPRHNRVSWMTYITQAGVTLGLAKKIHLENRVWGGGFATVIIACVVLNQLVGPPLMKWAIQYIGEHNKQKVESQDLQNGMSPQHPYPPQVESTTHLHDKLQRDASPTYDIGKSASGLLIVGDGRLALSTLSALVSMSIHEHQANVQLIPTSDLVLRSVIHAGRSSEDHSSKAHIARKMSASFLSPLKKHAPVVDKTPTRDDGDVSKESNLLNRNDKYNMAIEEDESEEDVILAGSVPKVLKAAQNHSVLVLMLPANDMNAMLAHAVLANRHCMHVNILIRQWPSAYDADDVKLQLKRLTTLKRVTVTDVTTAECMVECISKISGSA